MNQMNVKYTILYARLSQEDGRDGVSNSIENQQMILENYAETQGFENCLFKFDDGYSGTNFNRPAWKEVMALIESHQVATLIVKDSSRLGREYIQTGQLTEIVFPSYDVRYIAIHDNIDTLYGLDDFSPFRNLIADMFAKETSKKIRSVQRAKAEKGERVGNRLAYGYQKCVDKPNQIEPDEEVAPIIKEIFRLCTEGRGPTQIARELTKKEYTNPSIHYYNKTGVLLPNTNLENPQQWSTGTVIHILSNEIYLGHTINLKTTTKSYKDKKKIFKPADEWLRFENTHEAIISQNTWDIAQKVRETKKRPRKAMDTPNMFSGLTVCADCGAYMQLNRGHTMDPKRVNFVCATYKNKGRDCCSNHYITEMHLSAILLDDIKRVTHFARMQSQEFAEFIARKSTTETRKQILQHTRLISNLQKRNEELDRIFKKLYEDHVLGKIGTDIFQKLSDEYLKEQAELKNEIPKLEQELETLKASLTNPERFIEKAKEYCDIEVLTAETLRQFIDKIVIHDKGVKYSRTAMQKVEIHYRDIGYLGDCVENSEQESCSL